jgi:tRNA(fMet)-specific endonuclease VapC
MIILDTDHISALQYRDSPQAFHLQSRLETVPPNDVVTTIITLEEQTRSWLGLIRRYVDIEQQVAYYERFQDLFAFFAAWYVLPFDQRCAERFKELRRQRVRIGTMDLKIASIALVRHATLLSRNIQDCQQVADLQVEDWLQ